MTCLTVLTLYWDISIINVLGRRKETCMYELLTLHITFIKSLISHSLKQHIVTSRSKIRIYEIKSTIPFLQSCKILSFIRVWNFSLYWIYFSSIVEKALILYIHSRIRSWNQPVLSNQCKVSCSRKQQLVPDKAWIHAASDP